MGGDTISSQVDSIVSLVSPKKSYGPNSVGKNYFSATPFSLLAKNATGGRHTDNLRSPAPDIAVPRQALCYLSRSNRGLKNGRLFLQHPLFLAVVNPGNHKQQNTQPSKRILP